MPFDPLRTSASELLGRLESGEVTSVELTETYLKRIEKVDPQVKAFLRTGGQAALDRAGEIDGRRKRGQPVGRLAGLPVAVKDLLADKGERLTCGSRMLENFRSPYDATVVARLKAADAVLIGRANMDEFAMGGSSENSAYQITRNPWDLTRTPGGSSGGSAAAVAASMAPLAIGTDTGGSIRQPAGLCGVTGLKPTYGRVSRYGLVAFASSLDQAGPIAASALDAALLMEVIAGHDPLDATSLDVPTPEYFRTTREPLKNLRLGICLEHFSQGIDPEVERAVREAVRVYESLGAKIVEVDMPHARYGVATYYVIAPCEASSNLARYDGVHYGHRTDEKAMLRELAAEVKLKGEVAEDDGALARLNRRSRSEGFGPEVKRRIMLGAYALSAGYKGRYYVKALQARRLIRRDYDEAFAKVDLIIGPVTATPAFKIGEKSADPLEMYLVDLYTVSANLAGVPGLAMPCGFASGSLPIGLQLQGPPLAEEKLLRAAHMFQSATDWHLRRPLLAGGAS